MPFIIGDLVDDILIYILSLLSSPDILNVRLVCKRLDSLSRENGVWCDIFEREVVHAGKPCPGYSHFTGAPHTFLGGTLSASVLTDPTAYHDVSRVGKTTIANHSDLENRTMHALRLEQKWKTRSNNSLTSTFELPEITQELYLLRGGRFAVTVHSNSLRCWDLGFPATDGSETSLIQPPNVRCVGVCSLTSISIGRSVKMDTDTSVSWRAAQIGRFAIADNADHTSPKRRTCVIMSARCSSGAEYLGSSKITDDNANSGLLRQEATIKLPDTLAAPIYPSTEDHPEPRRATGRLGNLLHVHGNLLFFESFDVVDPCTEDANPETRLRFAGIEVINLSTTLSGNFASALLVYPDTRNSDCFGICVHETAEHIVIVWRYGIALYPIHEQLTRSSWVTSYKLQRVALLPSTVIGLTEDLQHPISFTTCKTHGHGLMQASHKKNNGNPEPLTILARSRNQPEGLIQRLLFAIKEPQPQSASNTTPAPQSQYSFFLMRIPPPSPPQYSVPPSTHTAVRNSNHANTNMHAHGVQHLALGPSGRGVRVDANGAVFHCAPSTLILPCFGGLAVGGGSELTLTVELSLHRRMDTLPTPPSMLQDALDSVHNGVPGDHAHQHSLIETQVRFDDGMGRLVATHTQCDDDSTGGDTARQGGSRFASRSVLTVMDFA